MKIAVKTDIYKRMGEFINYNYLRSYHACNLQTRKAVYAIQIETSRVPVMWTDARRLMMFFTGNLE